jgi:hypothetical protein
MLSAVRALMLAMLMVAHVAWGAGVAESSGVEAKAGAAPDTAGVQAAAGDAEETPERQAVGTATLTWDAPGTRADGQCLDGLAGFVVRWGNAPEELRFSRTVSVDEAQCVTTTRRSSCGPVRRCSYTVRNLGPGEWHFSVSAFDSERRMSAPSETVHKTIGSDGR